MEASEKQAGKISVLGAGGHGAVVIQLLRACKQEVGAIYDDRMQELGTERMGLPLRLLSSLPEDSTAIIAVGSNATRFKIATDHPTVEWITAVHPSAIIDPSATLGEGTVVMAGAIIQAGATIGRHVVVNTKATIDHGCKVGDFASIAPGATLCGTVTLGKSVWIGAGATVKEQTTVALDCVLGAGATLVKDMVVAGETWVGTPATKLAKAEMSQTNLPPPPLVHSSVASKSLRWVWPKWLDQAVFMRHLDASIQAGIFTNHGPGARALEAEAARRLHVSKHAVLAVCSGTAALQAMLAVHMMRGMSTVGGILVSAFGFPAVLQGNWTNRVRLVDMDAVHGGPILPSPDEKPPAVVCLVNPFGYHVDIMYYRKYCDHLGIPLWMDNASSPLTFLADGVPISEVADMVGVSLHETKAIGRGEGGLLFVPKEHEDIARRSINFGYDAKLPPALRTHHIQASNWRMSDFQAAAILTNWELGFDIVVQWMVDHDDEIAAIGPFKRGLKGSILSCLLETRQARPDMEIKQYYQPLSDRSLAPECWKFFDAVQCRPFHP